MIKNRNALFVFITFLLCVSYQVNAQLDRTNGTKEKGNTKRLLTTNAKAVEKPKAVDVNAESGFKNAYKEELKKQKIKEEEAAFNRKGIMTEADKRKMKMAENLEQNSIQIPMIDKDIGVFRTKSENINLLCFDFGQIDGDKIAVYLNGKLVLKDYMLKGSSSKFSIPLNEGLNRFEIKATSEGLLRPNTGAFTVYDDKNNIVIKDMWHLAEGAKVIAVVIKE